MALRRLTVESWDAMIRSLQESEKRLKKNLDDVQAKLEVAREMQDQARNESAQRDLVGQASKKP